MKLTLEALSKYLLGLLFMILLLFLPAGTLFYPSGWLFLALLFGPILILGVLLRLFAPHLLKKRLQAKETDEGQKKVVALSALLFLIGFPVAGLDFRFGWSEVPAAVTVAASAILLLSYVLYAEVMRENAYLSRTIEIQKDQKLIDTGLYGIVRHPMYTATVFLFLSIPLVLGSWWSFLCFCPYVPILLFRIQREELFLSQNLQGYPDYQKRVRYRLFPFLW